MTPKSCSYCIDLGVHGSHFVRHGFFSRTSDSKRIQRFICQGCRKTCSLASFSPWFRQKKRQKNEQLRKLLASHVSMRRAARHLCLNRKTVARKLEMLGLVAEARMRANNLDEPKASEIEFDDLETFEHTKCKPLSITLAVAVSRRILGLEVSSMPAKGLLVEKAKKYGPRADDRASARATLFASIQDLVTEDVHIKSDKNPHYPAQVREAFPKARHETFESRDGSLGGQGELKKTGFDPLFSLNHTCAMFRANVIRLARRTWCTTKRPDRLRALLMIYADYHNEQLAKLAN